MPDTNATYKFNGKSADADTPEGDALVEEFVTPSLPNGQTLIPGTETELFDRDRIVKTAMRELIGKMQRATRQSVTEVKMAVKTETETLTDAGVFAVVTQTSVTMKPAKEEK